MEDWVEMAAGAGGERGEGERAGGGRGAAAKVRVEGVRAAAMAGERMAVGGALREPR